jgi:hypothetical protein
VVAKQEGVACSTTHTPRTPCQPLAPRILRAGAIHPLPSHQHVNEHSFKTSRIRINLSYLFNCAIIHRGRNYCGHTTSHKHTMSTFSHSRSI